jgi:hypothetical protein
MVREILSNKKKKCYSNFSLTKHTPMDQGRRFLFPRRHSSSFRRVRIDGWIDRDVQSHGVPPRGASWLEDLRRLKATGLTNLYWPQQIFIRQALDSAEKGR